MVIGKPITVLIPPDRQHEEAVILARIGRGERVDHYETVRQRKDGSLVDISLTISPVRDGDGNIIGASKIARNITARKQAEEKTQILLHEIDHRGKNLLSTVHAVARMTQANSVPEFVDIFTGRLGALSRVHRVLAESRWRGADLRGLIDEELAAYGADTGWRVSISGTQIDLCAEAAQVLAMAIHELATNAAKYGAMSTPSGHVSVEWSWDSEGKLVLEWIETGGPTVSEPSHRGFGVTLIDRIIGHQLRGAVHLDWRPEGLKCQMSIPREKLMAARQA
jgi:two-component sensor histidine kinase